MYFQILLMDFVRSIHLEDVWANTDGPLLFTCFGGHRKCGVWWAIIPWFQGPARWELPIYPKRTCMQTEGTVNRTYELSGTTHVTLFPKYGKHSTGPSTYGPWVRTYSKSLSCKPVLTVCNYRAQSNEIFTYGEVSRGSVPRVRRYGLLYLRAVEYDHCYTTGSWLL